MRRIVVDTSVVAGLRTRSGAGNAVLRLVATRRLTMLATVPLFLEYEEVLKRAEQRLIHGLAPGQLEEFLGDWRRTLNPLSCTFSGGRKFEMPATKWS